jgi:hypothetical protein
MAATLPNKRRLDLAHLRRLREEAERSAKYYVAYAREPARRSGPQHPLKCPRRQRGRTGSMMAAGLVPPARTPGTRKRRPLAGRTPRTGGASRPGAPRPRCGRSPPVLRRVALRDPPREMPSSDDLAGARSHRGTSQGARLRARFASTATGAIAAVCQGIKRTHGTAQGQKAPVFVENLRAMCRGLRPGIIGIRDRALLLAGFAEQIAIGR